MTKRQSRSFDSEPPGSVMVLVSSNRRRGAEVFGERLVQGLSNFGWVTDFVAIQAADTDRIVGADPLRPTGAAKRFDIATMRRLRSRIRDRQPSIILANGGATLRYAITASAFLSSPPLVAYASIGEPNYWLRSPMHARLQRFLIGRADVTLAVSETTRRQLIEDLDVNADQVLIAHTGVPREYFIESDPSDGELRLLFLGSLSNEKDPQAALDVTARCLKHNPVRLRMVGDGPLRVSLAARIESQHLGEIVELTGSVDDVMPYLAWADVLILTSRTEGLPGAVLEAGAAGVPCVAFDVGGVSETMTAGVSGVVVPARDVDSMVTEIGRLADNPQMREKMGGEARRLVRDQFTLAHSIDRHHEIFSELLAASPGR